MIKRAWTHNLVSGLRLACTWQASLEPVTSLLFPTWHVDLMKWWRYVVTHYNASPPLHQHLSGTLSPGVVLSISTGIECIVSMFKLSNKYFMLSTLLCFHSSIWVGVKVAYRPHFFDPASSCQLIVFSEGARKWDGWVAGHQREFVDSFPTGLKWREIASCSPLFRVFFMRRKSSSRKASSWLTLFPENLLCN